MVSCEWNRRSSSYTMFTNTVMAANEVIDIGSGSSDDEYEVRGSSVSRIKLL